MANDEPLGTAGDIRYSEFEQFFDEQGNIINFQGLVNYTRTKFPELYKEIQESADVLVNPWGVFDEHEEEKMTEKFTELFSFMPGMKVDPSDIRSAQQQQQSSITSLLGDIKQQRFKGQSEAGMAGIYGLTDPLSQSGYENIYGDIGELTAGGKNIYGLGAEKEEEFATWAGDVFEGVRQENLD